MKFYKRKSLWFAVVLALFIAGFFWHKTSTKNLSLQYRVEKVKRGNITQTVSANGTLNPVILVNVGTQVSGTVQKIYADFNDRVKENQVLLELDSRILQAQLSQSKAAVFRAEAALDLAEANAKRGFPLFQHGDISKQDWDQLVQLRKGAVADLKLAKSQVTRDKTNLDYATIRSPVSGVVVDREVDVGQTVAASFQTPVLFKIAQDLSKMQIDSSFAEADIGGILPKQEVSFNVDAYPDRFFKGVVKQVRINPTTQQNVVTYDVVVSVDNLDGALLPGMTAYVNIKTAEHKNILMVPTAALRFHPKNAKPVTREANQAVKTGTIYKIVDDKLEPIVCKLGINDNRYTEVSSPDLKDGDAVVIDELAEGEVSTTNTLRVRVF